MSCLGMDVRFVFLVAYKYCPEAIGNPVVLYPEYWYALCLISLVFIDQKETLLLSAFREIKKLDKLQAEAVNITSMCLPKCC